MSITVLLDARKPRLDARLRPRLASLTDRFPTCPSSLETSRRPSGLPASFVLAKIRISNVEGGRHESHRRVGCCGPDRQWGRRLCLDGGGAGGVAPPRAPYLRTRMGSVLPPYLAGRGTKRGAPPPPHPPPPPPPA